MRTRLLAPGTAVWIRQRLWRTERTLRDHAVVQFEVARADQRATFLAPFDRPNISRRGTRVVRVREQQGLAALAGALAATHGVRTLIAARDARIDLLPYQLEPALAILDGHRRVLVADDVGLGKTVQAGLVIAELTRRLPACRVLVIAPASLCDQWAAELATRFSLATQRATEPSLTALDRDRSTGWNPWRQPGIWLTSSDWVKQAHVLGGIPLAPWDLVVVDEAHAVVGRTERHEACAELIRRARHALLLSATPHSGDDTRFARLLALGELAPDEHLVTFRRTGASVGLTRRRHVRWARLRPSARAGELLDCLATFERTVLARGLRANRDAALLLLAVFRRRALSSFAALERSLTRRLAWLARGERETVADAFQPSLHFGDADDDMPEEERDALWQDAGLRPADERGLLEDLRQRTRRAIASDPKLARLRRLAARTREPMVIFTEFRDSLEAAQAAVEPFRSAAVMHGGQTGLERSEQLARFLRGEATALVATDVAGQGLNLQTRARWVVNLELPWNPSRIEQRIGRVDRIGQLRVVHVSMLVVRHRMEAPLIQSLARRVLAVHRALGEGVDTLAAAPPSQALAAAVFDGAPLVLRESSRTLPAPSHMWARAARANVDALARRRSWRRHWRGALDGRSRPVAWSSRRAASGTVAPTTIVGFAVPIVDRTGLEVERHIVALAVVVPHPLRVLATPQLRAVAAQLLAVRTRRAARWIRAAVARTTSNERAIERHLLSVCRPREMQSALFGSRRTQGLHRTDANLEQIFCDRDARLTWDAHRSHLCVGAPELLWVWTQS